MKWLKRDLTWDFPILMFELSLLGTTKIAIKKDSSYLGLQRGFMADYRHI